MFTVEILNSYGQQQQQLQQLQQLQQPQLRFDLPETSVVSVTLVDIVVVSKSSRIGSAKLKSVFIASAILSCTGVA